MAKTKAKTPGIEPAAIHNKLELEKKEIGDQTKAETAADFGEKNIQRLNWKEFQDTGLLLFINQILHIFGLCIVIEFDDQGNQIDAYPARTKFRGFSVDRQAIAYSKLARYVVKNAEMLQKETDSEE
jgi:hypothetical protein